MAILASFITPGIAGPCAAGYGGCVAYAWNMAYNPGPPATIDWEVYDLIEGGCTAGLLACDLYEQ